MIRKSITIHKVCKNEPARAHFYMNQSEASCFSFFILHSFLLANEYFSGRH